jgi:hypothetical protein
MRSKQLYDWWHDVSDEPERVTAMRWFSQWTGSP